jgi:isopentenyl-diphosphate delta-isomerase
VRDENPDGIVFTNIGAAEVGRLGRDRKIRELLRIIDLVNADGLVIHLNPLQELLQPEGSPDFRGVLSGIIMCVSELGVPVIVKEVGAGISQAVAMRLVEAGVRAIDVAGAGGTSWAGVELLRQSKKRREELGVFWDWGISTFDALVDVAALRQKATFGLIASGGIHNGVDAAKAIALGADLVGIARPIMLALTQSGPEGVREAIRAVTTQLRCVMFLTGSRNLADLAKQPLRRL